MRRLAAIGTITAVVIGVATSAGLVWSASYSAFSAQTTTPTNNWTAGTVALDNAQTGSALWTSNKIKPGFDETKCVTVTSSGNLPSVVKMYVTPGSFNSSALAPYVTFYITQGSGTAGGSNCSGFTNDATGSAVFTGLMSTMSSNVTSYGSGAGSWTTTGTAGETKVYRIRLTFTQGAATQAQVDALQGVNAAIGFTWEAQNT